MEIADIPVIKRLQEDVVNRIAAGEVIQRPSNAIKEMLENSLDAGSKNITVSLKGGGLKMLQILDDGHGIRKEDMKIVCERFTTSKLREFSDLSSMTTFGFRGEALASISHVSHLAICTRTKDSQCAYKATYADGRIKDSPRPTAGSIGTQITVEDLFYNVPTRRKALNNPADEHQRIADVISKYSIHNAGVSFTLRKAGEGGPSGGISVRTQQGSSILDNIGVIYGTKISKDLISIEQQNTSLKFEMHGYVSNANCSMKKFILLLFINNRLVDCSPLKRSLANVYQTFLPKGTHPFVYMSLKIAPANIDVNVHPTKHEVHFLHEAEIIESIQRAVEVKLRSCDTSRTFYTQTLLPNVSINLSEVMTKKSNSSEIKTYAHETIRTDGKLQKLDAFLKPRSANSSMSTSNDCQQDIITKLTEPVDNIARSTADRTISKLPVQNLSGSVAMEIDSIEPPSKKLCVESLPLAKNDVQISKANNEKQKSDTTTSSFPKRKHIRLTSVLKLQQEIKENAHDDLVKVIGNHVWVGCIDPELALIQFETKLFMTNTSRLSEELFYQIMVFDFGNFGIYRLSEPVPVFDMVMLALNSTECGWQPADGNKIELAKNVVEFLKTKREMLADYFSLEVNEEGNIVGLPMLLPDYEPSMEGLPMFLLRITTEVNWESEIECFRTFCRECARFYSVRKGYINMPNLLKNTQMDTAPDDSVIADSSVDCEGSCFNSQNSDSKSWKWVVEHLVYRALQRILLPGKSMLSDGTFLQLASLPDLYKVFERC